MKTRPSPAMLPVLCWTVFILLAGVFVYGFAHEHLLLEPVWLAVGFRRLWVLAVAYGAVALLAYRFKPRGFFPLMLSLAGLYAFATLGLGPLAAAAVVICAAVALGDLVLTRGGMRREAVARLEGLVLSFLTGTALISLVVGVAAHFPVNYAWIYAAALAAPVWINRRALMFYAAEVGRRGDCWSGASSYFALAGLGFVLLAHFLLVLKPEVGYDALAMHLVAPAYVAVHHAWSFDVQQFIWAVMPMTGDWSYTPAYLLGGEFAAHLMNFAYLGAILMALYCLLRRRLSRPLSVLGVAVFASSPLAGLVTGSLFIENVLGAFILGAVLAMDRARRNPAPAFLFSASLLLGSAMATKLGAVVFVIPLAIFLFRRSAFRGRVPARQRMAAAAVLLIVSAWSYAMAWSATGNPVFPFMNNVFRSPYYAPVAFDNPLFNQRLSWHSLYGVEFRTHEYLESQDGAAGFQYLWLFPMSLMALAYGRRSIAVTAAAAAGLAGCMAVLEFQPYLRYLYPGFALITAAGFASLALIRNRAPGLARVFVAACVALAALNIYFFAASGWYHRGFYLLSLFNQTENQQYIDALAPSRRAIDYLNVTSPGQPAWFLGPPQIAGLIGRPYVANWHQPVFNSEVSAAKTAPDLLTVVKGHGLHYFVAPRDLTEFKDSPAIFNFLSEYTVTQWQAGSIVLRRLRSDAALTTMFDSPDAGKGWTEWQRNGNPAFVPASGAMKVSLTDTLVRGVPVRSELDYLYSMEASCPEPDTELRLQINWHDASGKFIATALDPRPCDLAWRTYAKPVKPPENARSGIVIIGGHGAKPVLVRRAWMEY